ncbi:MAG: CHRD domain-containing protein [Bacteroidia bacterium]
MKKFTRLKYYYFLLAGILSVFQLSAQTTHVVTSSANFEFVPSFIQVMAGDTVDWQIDGMHNVIEVSLQSYNNNTATSNGGFTLPFGGGKQAFPNPGVYYYICQPHASLAMKGVIFVTSDAVETYTASLSGHQQSVPVITTGKGNVTATLDGTTLVIDGSFSNLDGDFNANIAGGAHLHKSIAGRNGGIEIGLTTNLNANMKSGSFLPDSNIYTITPAQAEAIRNREIYLNIHTTTHGPGEIRGQLLPSGTYYSTHLFGSFQRVPVISEGGGLLVLDLVGDTLTVSGSFDNLNSAFNSAVAGGAHLHNGLSGQNGGINIGLKATVDTDQLGGIFEADSNKFFVNAAQKASLEERRLYANIHTLTSPGGELRGQVVGMPQVVFRAFLSGANQPAPIVTAATGMAVLELKGDQLTVSGSFTGLESDFNINVAGGAHIHSAVAGRNGGISQGLTTNLDVNNREGTFESGTNTYTVDSAQMANLFNRAMYINIHTVNNGSGELRGQILPEANYYFQSQLSGTQAAPPVLSRGGGALLAEVRGNGLVISGSFDNLTGDYNPNIAGGSHLHGAYAGSNGPIKIGLTPTLDGDNLGGIYEPESNTYTLSTTLRDSVKRRLLYANIHTTAVGSGEVRGQMLAEASNYFYAPISGSSQRNPLDREATGTVAGEWLANQLIVSGSFRNLASDFNANVAGGAHLHSGLPGETGRLSIL